MKLTVVRHGETIENAAGIIQGQMQGHLSEKGISQATEVAEKLRTEHFDLVISSDLKRCLDTTAYLMRYHPDVKIETSVALREIHFGDFQGLKSDAVDWDSVPGSLLERKAPHGESGNDMRARVAAFISELLMTHANESILLVTHAGPMRAIRSMIEGINPSESVGLKIDNCAILQYEISEL